MNIKHIYWFAFYNLDSPSVRYRGKYVLDYLSQHSKITYTFFYPEPTWSSRLRFIGIFLHILFFRKRDSLLVFQKICSNGLYARTLKLLLFFRSNKTVYDIDDAEYMRYPEDTIRYFMERCETCFTGSEILSKYAVKYNSDALFLTSPIHIDPIPKSDIDGVFTVGWIGEYSSNSPATEQYSHKANMEQLIFPALQSLQFQFRLEMIGIQTEEDRLHLQQLF
ncbi:MAG: glycosyl transferase group 1 [Bacteroidetes bacterium]|nr:glycosyl transferase group 1 [Bacteroidota bacterium]